LSETVTLILVVVVVLYNDEMVACFFEKGGRAATWSCLIAITQERVQMQKAQFRDSSHTRCPRELVSFGVKNRKGEPHIDRRYARCCDTSRRRDVGRGGGWRESGNVKARACIPMVQAIRLLMLWCASQKQGMVSMCCGDLLYFIAIYIHIVLNFLHQRLVNPIIDEFSITKQLFCSLEMLRNALMHSLLHFPKPISTQSPQHSFTLVSIGKIKTLLFPLSHFSIRLLASFLGVSQGLAQGTSLLKKNKTVVNEWEKIMEYYKQSCVYHSIYRI
jgi:hypothetical protein